MPVRMIDGNALAGRIRSEAAARVQQLAAAGLHVRLDAVLVGEPDAGAIYARSQASRCAKVGIDYRLHTLAAGTTDEQLQTFLTALSRNPDVTGIMLNLPLPPGLDTPVAQYTIDPYKDVEGVNPANIGLLFYGTPIIAPCTALAVMAILKEAGVEVRGRDVVVVGQGATVGKPIALALMGEEATVRTCNKYTADLPAHTRDADVVIAAAGVPGLLGKDHIRPGAVVIDVGINSVPDPKDPSKSIVVGDVRTQEVAEVAGILTPVPGGVGPVTVAMLLRSTAEAAARQWGFRRIQ